MKEFGKSSAAIVEHKWNLFLELMRFAEAGSCRHDAVLRYFGDEEETLAGCGICDVCVALAEGGEQSWDPELVTPIARKALSAVARIHGRLNTVESLFPRHHRFSRRVTTPLRC